MGEQRPMFRFRLPWMISSAPAPPPIATQSPPRATTTEASSTTSQPQPNINPITPARRPFRLQQIAPPSPPPPQGQMLPVTGSQSPAKVTVSTITPLIRPTPEGQRSSEPITTTPVPTVPSQAPPLWSPRRSAAQDPLLQAEVTTETKSQPQISDQPTSPSRTHSQATSELPLSSLTSPQFSATSQLPSPSLTSPQSSATSQPPSPWRRPPLEQNAPQLPSQPLPSPQSISQPSSPWRKSPQQKDASQPSSPNRPQFQKSSQTETFHQPQSPSKLDFQSSSQTSLGTSSPTLTATNVQPTGRTVTQAPSPLVHKPLSPVSAEPSLVVSKPQPLEARSKTEATPSAATKSPMQAIIPPTGTAGKLQEVAGPLAATPPPLRIAKEMPPKQWKSDDTMIESLAVHLTETSGSSTRNEEQLNVASKVEQRQLKNKDLVQEKEVPTSKTSNQHEKQTKTMILRQTDNKRTATESRIKNMISNGNQISFQKEIRNDIYKLAAKMSRASPENLKDGKPVTIVSLVGKNRGASMQLGFEPIKKGSFSSHKDYNIKPGENAEAETEGKKSSKRKWSKHDINKEYQATKAHANSNIQEINNSILMNSLISERNPGVHLALYYNPTEPTMSCDKTMSLEEREGKSILPPPKGLPVNPPSKGDS